MPQCYLCKVKVPFVKGGHFTESSMAAHTDYGLGEMSVKCEGVDALILSTKQCVTIPTTLSRVALALSSFVSLACTKIKLNILQTAALITATETVACCSLDSVKYFVCKRKNRLISACI